MTEVNNDQKPLWEQLQELADYATEGPKSEMVWDMARLMRKAAIELQFAISEEDRADAISLAIFVGRHGVPLDNASLSAQAKDEIAQAKEAIAKSLDEFDRARTGRDIDRALVTFWKRIDALIASVTASQGQNIKDISALRSCALDQPASPTSTETLPTLQAMMVYTVTALVNTPPYPIVSIVETFANEDDAIECCNALQATTTKQKYFLHQSYVRFGKSGPPARHVALAVGHQPFDAR